MQKIYLYDNFYYEVFNIKGRTIYSPSKSLKEFQKLILNFIKLKFNIKLNIKNAALVHCNQKWILKSDIKDFYPSVSKELIKQAIDIIYCNIELPKHFSKEMIYELCTLKDKLPTGAVTSAHLANIAFSITQIDDKLLEFCKKEKINYSRYMDDMFFSCSNKEKLQQAEKYAEKLLNEAGFMFNKEKTKYICNNKQQEILGLVVNNREYPVISAETKRKYRCIFFNYLKSVYLEERLGVGSLFLKKTGYKEVCGYLSYIKNNDNKFYCSMQKFISSKIKKFGLYDNDEIRKLKKVIK